MTHDESKWDKAYDPNCMCENCHRVWELLIMAGDSITISNQIQDMNELSNDTR
jgi:hypothetical protein